MKIIKFIPFSKPNLDPPDISKIPQWWKDGEYKINSSSGMKACIPFMEIMMSGYTVNLPFDIYIDTTNKEQIKISWDGPKDGEWTSFIQERPISLGLTIPRPTGHLENHFVWYSQWSFKTPKNHSVLITHPFNRFDLPFTTVSGIIDSDKFYGNGKIPFFVKEGFMGVLKKGTPIFQVFPFKRQTWSHRIDDSEVMKIYRRQITKLTEGSYKKLFWVKKKY